MTSTIEQSKVEVGMVMHQMRPVCQGGVVPNDCRGPLFSLGGGIKEDGAVVHGSDNPSVHDARKYAIPPWTSG